MFLLLTVMVKTYLCRFQPSPNLDKVIISFDKLINTDLFLLIHVFFVFLISPPPELLPVLGLLEW